MTDQQNPENADSVSPEEKMPETEAAKKVPKFKSNDSNDRNKRVAQSMEVNNQLFSQPLCPSRSDEILSQNLQHRTSNNASIACQRISRQRNGGKNELIQSSPSTYWNPSQKNSEDEDEH